jgi:hypothetical protein
MRPNLAIRAYLLRNLPIVDCNDMPCRQSSANLLNGRRARDEEIQQPDSDGGRGGVDVGGRLSSAKAVNWNGFYAGVVGGFGWYAGEPISNYHFAGKYGLIGYNWRSGDVVFGVEEIIGLEAEWEGSWDSPYVWWQKTGRIGVLMNEDVLLFGLAGVGTPLGDGIYLGSVLGAGIEWAVTDNLSLRKQIQVSTPFEDPEDHYVSVMFGAVWHAN